MRWARKNLADILYVEAVQDPETLAKKAIAQFEIDFNLKVLKRDVPCYRILQSISFSAFSTVPAYLSQTFCPSLFDPASNQPLMKTFPTDTTRYEIKIDPGTGVTAGAKMTHPTG
jgi:hypothetical protein